MAEGDRVRIIPHRPAGVPGTGSFEVVYPGGRKFFYWDDIAGRRLRDDILTSDQALAKARALAQAQRDKLKL